MRHATRGRQAALARLRATRAAAALWPQHGDHGASVGAPAAILDSHEPSLQRFVVRRPLELLCRPSALVRVGVWQQIALEGAAVYLIAAAGERAVVQQGLDWERVATVDTKVKVHPSLDRIHSRAAVFSEGGDCEVQDRCERRGPTPRHRLHLVQVLAEVTFGGRKVGAVACARVSHAPCVMHGHLSGHACLCKCP